jgi:aspartate racemase
MVPCRETISPAMTAPAHIEKLGLIGGLGVGATIHYYETLAGAARKAGFVLPLVMAHADVDRVLADVAQKKFNALAAYLAQHADALAAAGATFGAIASVTPHICFEAIAAQTSLPLISIVETTARDVERRGLRRVAVFGTRFTIETNFFGGLPGVDIVQPRPQDIETVHQSYISLVAAGKGSVAAEAALREVAQALIRNEKVEAILLAGTELALVFSEETASFPVLDCGRAHRDAIIARLTSHAVRRAAPG